MRLKNLLLFGAMAATTQVGAQSWIQDTVVMGTGYANDVFYSLQNGSAKTEPSTNWHIAFQMVPQSAYGNVSVYANHVQGGVKVYSLHMTAADFTTVADADTVGKTGAMKELLNADTSWNYGAFNKLASSNPFDYGWGMYDMGTHHVNGDSLFLVNVGSGATMQSYKLTIQQYKSNPSDSVQWIFRVARWDGSDDTTVRIYRKPDYTDRLFAYYNLDTRTVLDREPGRQAWDMLFTRYREYTPGAPGLPYYPVMGVLTNFDVLTHQKDNTVEGDITGFQTYPYTDTINEIGSDWKSFNSTTMQWTFKDSTYYFVKTLNTNEYWQVNFLGFSGQATGEVYFRKRLLGQVNSVHELNTTPAALFVAPNPANHSASVMLDSKDAAGETRVLVTDMTGRVVIRQTVQVRAGMNAFELNTASLPAGTYILSLANGSWKQALKLAVQH